MSRGRKSNSSFTGSDWESVFYNSVGAYVNVINNELSKEFSLEPLSSYIKIGGGYAFKTSEYKKSGIPIIRISDFNNEQIDISNCVYYDENDSLSKYELKENDIIICLTGGTIAKLGIVQLGLGKLYMNQRVGRFDILDDSKFEKEYVYWIARSVQNIIKNLAWGAAIPNVSPKQIEELKFPFPSIEIQKGIVTFLNDLKNNSIIEDRVYFNKQIENDIIELHQKQINTSLISSELSHQLSLIKQLRKAFLQEAMQGLLVKTETNGETGAELREKIKVEKAQLIKEKKIKQGKLQEAEVLEDLLFEIPEHWIWCNLDDICYNITDGTHQTPQYTNSGRMFLSAQNVKPFKFMPENHKFVSEEDYQNYIKNRKPEKGDLLIGRVGAGIGETAVIDQDLDFCIYVSVALVQPFKKYINSDYLAQVFNSPYGVRYSKGNVSSKGGSAGNFNLGRIRSFQIPLPPLNEQEQIVAKLDELMDFCDGLEKSIKESQGLNEILLNEVLREALQGDKIV